MTELVTDMIKELAEAGTVVCSASLLAVDCIEGLVPKDTKSIE